MPQSLGVMLNLNVPTVHGDFGRDLQVIYAPNDLTPTVLTSNPWAITGCQNLYLALHKLFTWELGTKSDMPGK